jgi:hypothetical protein
MTTITRIEHSDRNDSTHVVDIIHLSNGEILSIWNGNACYGVYDEAKGRVVVGAKLASVSKETTHSGEEYNVYTFV